MRKLLVVSAVFIGASVAFHFLARGPRARLRERLLGAIEACPPIAKMSALQQQNDDVITLLREQNELLRQRAQVDGLAAASPA
jgi:hypothetical protein